MSRGVFPFTLVSRYVSYALNFSAASIPLSFAFMKLSYIDWTSEIGNHDCNSPSFMMTGSEHSLARRRTIAANRLSLHETDSRSVLKGWLNRLASAAEERIFAKCLIPHGKVGS